MFSRHALGNKGKNILMVTAAVIAAGVLGFPPFFTVSGALAADQPDMALIKKGRQISDTVAGVGCKGCHGAYGEGDVGIGPFARGVDLSKISSAIGGIKQMEFLKKELKPDDIKALGAYYSWLGSLKLVKTIVKRGRFIPDKVEVYPGTTVQLVISNTSTAVQSFSGDKIGIKTFTVPAREVVDMVWNAPETEGSYSLQCPECMVKDQSLTFVVTRTAKKHVDPMASVPAAAGASAPVQVAAVSSRKFDENVLDHGREMFLNIGQVGCVACHGPYAEGDVGIGPYNRGRDEQAIRKALKTVAAMNFLNKELNDTQIKQIAVYYEWLGQLKLIKTHVVGGRFFPDKLDVAPGTKVQLVVVNRNHSHIRIAAEKMDLGISPYSISAQESQDRVWTAPAAEGVFTLQCTDCALKGEKLTINVTKAAK